MGPKRRIEIFTGAERHTLTVHGAVEFSESDYLNLIGNALNVRPNDCSSIQLDAQGSGSFVLYADDGEQTRGTLHVFTARLS